MKSIRGNKAYYILFVIVIAVAVYGLVQIFNQNEHYRRTEFTMDTVVTVDIYTQDEAAANEYTQQVFALFDKWDQLLDIYNPDSLIYQINNEGAKDLEVPEGIITMIAESKRFHEKSDGSFDITITPLMDVWGFGQGEQEVPSQQELEEALARVDLTRVEINQEKNLLYVPQELQLDFGSVAKGFVVDLAIEKLDELGVDNALINAGGNIGVLGPRPDRPWNLGIRDPREETEDIFSDYILALESGGMATSGDYQRYFEEDGVRYSHLIDPETGYQARDMRSATIFADNALKADILSTTIFVMGWEEGQTLVEQLPEVEALLVRDNEIWYSSGFSEILREN